MVILGISVYPMNEGITYNLEANGMGSKTSPIYRINTPSPLFQQHVGFVNGRTEGLVASSWLRVVAICDNRTRMGLGFVAFGLVS